MRKVFACTLAVSMAVGLLSGCSTSTTEEVEEEVVAEETTVVAVTETENEEAVEIVLSDSEITIDGVTATSDTTEAVYVDNDIVYYEEDQDFTYGAGDDDEPHSQEDADAHTVVHITEAGTYSISGELSLGQISIDLGEDASVDPDAVVTIILNGVDVTCEVAPALIFYNVYECCDSSEETASETVDTSAAGANIIIADDTVNNFTGSHVARIYDADSVELSADGTEVETYETLHKYDAAFYSKMSMNIDAEDVGTGILNIVADDEGLDSELHLTINGGIINIESGNDGINTNEDNVSVTTINGGTLTIYVAGGTGEGDGIDSNGWLVINGGTVVAQACALEGSMAEGWMGDAGIDSDLGIYINGGYVFSTGHMFDSIADSDQNFAVFVLADFEGEGLYEVQNSEGNVVAQEEITNAFTYLIVSYDGMEEGEYTLWYDGSQIDSATANSDAVDGHQVL